MSLCVPNIVLPEDEDIVRRLRTKLEEYEGRIDPMVAPERQMSPICKAAVAKYLLENGHVEMAVLADDLHKRYGEGFSWHFFERAFAIMEDYVYHGGRNLHNSTGF